MTPDDDIELVLPAHKANIGIPVARAIPQAGCRAIGPVVFVDHFGPLDVPPGPAFDVRPHPHIGLSTVSYLFEGEIIHRDSLGYTQPITPGAVNVMTAGNGIVHSERRRESVRDTVTRSHGLQLWVALPTSHEDGPASFVHHPAEAIPEVTRDGMRARVLLGELYGVRSPASTPSNPVIAVIELRANAEIELPAEVEDMGLYVIEGAVARGDDTFHAHTMIVRRPLRSLRVRAVEDSKVLLVGGPRLEGQTTRSPRWIEWNFVASSKERIEDAKRRWRAGAFPLIPTDHAERIPLPGDKE